MQVKDLKQDKNNYRNHSKANLDLIKKSVDNCGFGRSIVIDKNNEIIAGNGLVSTIKKDTKIKVVETDGSELVVVKRTDLNTDDQKRKELALADNAASDQVDWNLDNLSLDFDLNALGEYGINLKQAEVDPAEIVEDTIPEDAPAIAKLGEIYLLGSHRLMCGDSTSKSDVAKLMDGKKADLLVTEPPYNVNIKNSKGMKIENDNMDTESFKEFLNLAFENASEFLIPGGAFYVWHGDNARVPFQQALEAHELTVKQCLIWSQNGFTLGRQDYKWAHEPCLYGWKEGDSHYFIEEFNHPTVIEDKIDLKKLKKQELLDLANKLLSNAQSERTTVIHADKPVKNDLHPTMKPNQVIADQIRNSSRVGEIVLDLFGGSGTTLIAAEQLHRNCYCMEFDPRYVDVIIARWEAFTHRKAVKCK